MLFMHSCNYLIELNVWSGCMYFPVLSYRFPIVIGMLPTDWFRSRYPVIPILFSRPIFPFPFPFPTKKIQLRERLRGFPDRSRPFPTVFIPNSMHGEGRKKCLWIKKWNIWKVQQVDSIGWPGIIPTFDPPAISAHVNRWSILRSCLVFKKFPTVLIISNFRIHTWSIKYSWKKN